jgi:O-antigen/teichoic acid export membrane protein
VVIRAVGSRNEREQKVPWDAEIFRQFIVFGLKGFLGRISGQIDLNAGKYVLISAPPASQITAFALPQSLVYRAAGLVTQTATAFFPLASSLSHPEKRKTLKSMYHTLQIMLFITAVCVAVFVYAYGDVFLNWWLKDPVLTSSTSLPFKIMSLFFILLSLSSLPSTIVDSLGHPEYTSYIAFSNSLLNISLLILLVPGRGAYGAALASLFALLITLPILLIVTEKLLKR